jgi:hypothetical protein
MPLPLQPGGKAVLTRNTFPSTVLLRVKAYKKKSWQQWSFGYKYKCLQIICSFDMVGSFLCW